MRSPEPVSQTQPGTPDMPDMPDMPDTPRFILRDFIASDGEAVNAVAVAAFSEFKNTIDNWPARERVLGRMSDLAAHAEIIVADVDGVVGGAVAYIGPGIPKQEWFDPSWPAIRMLVVHPSHRGLGIGRALTEECVRRAQRDGAPLIALHTSPIMGIALAMYERMGFRLEREMLGRDEVPYAVYVKPLR